jgi:outer membrane protein assembly factor BamB
MGRPRIVLFVLLLAVAAAGCAGVALQAPTEHAQRAATAPRPRKAPVVHAKAARPSIHVRTTVIVRDRITGRTVSGAWVRLGRHRARSDRHGVARFASAPRTTVQLRVSAAGYAVQRSRIRLRHRRYATAYVWRSTASWPMYGGSPGRTQAPPGIGLRPPLRPVYSVKMDGLVELPPVTRNGIGYVTSDHGTLVAFSTENGSLRFRRWLRARMASSPAVVGQTLVVTGLDGRLRGYDALTGRLRWSRRLGGASETSPLILPYGRVAVATWSGGLLVIRARDGHLVWERQLGVKVTSAPALTRGLIVLGDYAGRVSAYSALGGRLRWRSHVNGRVYAAPAAAGGRVFVTSSTGGSLTVLSARSGRVLWSRSLGGSGYAAPAVAGGIVVAGSYSGRLAAFRASSGRRIWSAYLGGRISGAPQIVAGVVWAASFRGITEARTLARGRLLQRFHHGEYVPLSGDARTLLLVGYQRVWGLRPVHRHRRTGGSAQQT